MQEVINAFVAVWNFLISFPPSVASAVMGVIIIIVVITMAAIAIRRPPFTLSLKSVAWPVGLYGLAWLCQAAATWQPLSGASPFFWVCFSLLALVSFIWSGINMFRAVFNF